MKLTRRGATALVLGLTLPPIGAAVGNLPLVVAGLVALAALAVARGIHGIVTVEGSRVVKPEWLLEGQTVEFALEVRSRSRFPISAVIENPLPAIWAVSSGDNVERTVLSSSATTEVEFGAVPLIRGSYRLEPAVVHVHDPFGLVRDERPVSDRIDVTVVPAPVPELSEPPSARRSRGLPGIHRVPKPGPGTEFYGLREYQPSDPLRDVNWKASARVGELIVTQREFETTSELVAVVDARAWTGEGPARYAPVVQACRVAAAMLDISRDRSDAFRIVWVSDQAHTIPLESGRTYRTRVLETLAEIEPRGDAPMDAALRELLPRMKARTLVVMATPLTRDERIPDAIAMLMAHEFDVLVVPVPGPDGVDPDLMERVRAMGCRISEDEIREPGLISEVDDS